MIFVEHLEVCPLQTQYKSSVFHHFSNSSESLSTDVGKTLLKTLPLTCRVCFSFLQNWIFSSSRNTSVKFPHSGISQLLIFHPTDVSFGSAECRTAQRKTREQTPAVRGVAAKSTAFPQG